MWFLKEVKFYLQGFVFAAVTNNCVGRWSTIKGTLHRYKDLRSTFDILMMMIVENIPLNISVWNWWEIITTHFPFGVYRSAEHFILFVSSMSCKKCVSVFHYFLVNQMAEKCQTSTDLLTLTTTVLFANTIVYVPLTNGQFNPNSYWLRPRQRIHKKAIWEQHLLCRGN